MTSSPTVHAADQAHRPLFRALLAVQLLATTVFGLVPLVVPGLFASITGYSGDDEVVYRFAGAATAGYFVAALLALAWRSSWRELRLPIVATFTFNVAAALASAWTFVEGDRHWVVVVVFLAAVVFAALAGYWLRADEGADDDAVQPIDRNWLVLLGLATAAATLFGVLGLIGPGLTATIAGLQGTDAWIFRMSGAACLGYAPAGLLSILVADYGRIRIQNLAAITFNAAAAVAAAIAVVSGGGGLVAPVVMVAAAFFAVALVLMDRRYAGAR
jgi:hypothetical protein